MNIALDYDGTTTRDPGLWSGFVLAAVAAGHDVRIVTMRYPSEGKAVTRDGKDKEGSLALDSFAKIVGIPVIYTGRMAKRPICERMGFPVHVWIDDNPRAVDEDAAQIWDRPAPEGHPIDPVLEEQELASAAS
jgi:hypothetical protein